MKRRDVIVLLGGAAAALRPITAAAQQVMRRVGVLVPFSEHDPAFVQALSQFGWGVAPTRSSSETAIDYHGGRASSRYHC